MIKLGLYSSIANPPRGDHLDRCVDQVIAEAQLAEASLAVGNELGRRALLEQVSMLEIIETELRVAMKLLGVNRCAELDGSYLQPAPAVGPPGPFSAFPLL